MRRRPNVAKLLEGYYESPAKRKPHYIDEGQVFLYPSIGEPGRGHIVVWFPYHYGRPEQFTCSCPARGGCWHITNLKGQLHAARSTQPEPGGSRAAADAVAALGP